MTSTGNDIVALSAIDIHRTNQYRFYSKILTVLEQELYKNYREILSFEVYVWLLWSVKESLYKFLQRHDPDLVFSPSRKIIKHIEFPGRMMNEEFTDSLEGKGFDPDKSVNCLIEFKGQTFYSFSYLYKDLIATFVNDQTNFSNVYWGVKRIPSNVPHDQSAAVRQFTLNRIFTLFPGSDLEIVKNNSGCPTLSSSHESPDIPVSIAHHEYFVGYSFEL